MRQEIYEKLCEISGSDYVIQGRDKVEKYMYDESSEVFTGKAESDCVVVKPADVNEISEIMKLANEEKVPVIVRGGATGIAAGLVPYQPSIIIAIERMNKVIEIDNDNQMIVVEAAVTLADLNEALVKENFMFPVHPGDEGAHVGGMVVTNAGGVRAVKHGVMRNHIKGIEVVLPTGEIVNWGGKIIKNNAGYDLMHLMIGSEGGLGVVTKVILKTYPRGKNSATLIASFEDYIKPSEISLRILKEGIIPLAIEYIGRAGMEKSAELLGLEWPSKQGMKNLVVILDEESEDLLYEKCEKIAALCDEYGALETLMADTAKEQKEILEIRSAVYELNKLHKRDDVKAIGFDTAVPISKIKEYYIELEKLSEKYGTNITGGGHLGDGNLHLRGNFPYDSENKKFLVDVVQIEKDVLELTLNLGGTVSAEHGIGKMHKENLKYQFSETELQIMKNIKKAFDPNNIMNPGVIIS